MIDTDDLLRRVNLERLIGTDTHLRGSPGREKHGACPFCPCSSRERNHTCDRFRLNASRDRWYCRRCTPLGGTAIDYVMRCDNLTFIEACESLGSGTEKHRIRHTSLAQVTKKDEVIAPEPTPSATWQASAEAFVLESEHALWTPAAERARAWLHQRGLTDDALEGWRIGYCAADHYAKAGDWDTERDVSLPRGIVIPWL